ncbi:MAG: CHASE2 domain-containing protein [Verrucomicrobia bacterium]|nr:CHASE2 domain-containing protein [Verrucomicrobiota bacterium]
MEGGGGGRVSDGRTLGWMLAGGLAIGLGSLSLPGTRAAAAGTWTALNALVLVVVGVWALGHPFRWLREFGMMVRWAFWPAILGTLLLRSTLEPVLVEVTGQWLPSSVFYAISVVVFLPLLFVGCLLWTLAGAALGAYRARRDPAPGAGTRRAIRWWWLWTAAAAMFWAAWSSWAAPVEWVECAVAGIPAGVLLMEAWMRRSGGPDPAVWLDAQLLRWLVWRRRAGRSLDLRAEALAVTAFLIVWAAASLKLLLPLQASALLYGVQILNGAYPGRLQITPPSRPPWIAPGPEDRAARVRVLPGASFSRVGLLEWDVATRRAATTTNSEAGVHAALLRTLSTLGARRIVLPLPEADAPLVDAVLEADLPPPDAAERVRNQAHRGDLLTAMRQAGNVLLLGPGRSGLDFGRETNAVPDPPEATLQALRSAAAAVGSARWSPVQIAALPALPLGGAEDEPPPASLLLAAALHGSTNVHPVPLPERRVRVLDREYPVMDAASGRLLLDFVTPSRGREFPRIPYSSVLNAEPLFDPEAAGGGAWLPAEAFFRDRVVLLQPLRARPLASPGGAISPMEMVAHGVRTLLGEFFVHPVSPVRQGLWALLCAWVIGRLAVRRNPIKAAGLLAAVVLVTGVAFLVLLARGDWLDPVFPTAAAVCSFLLVTQLTFRLEQRARERSRFLLDRFVAPEVVEELLAPAAAPLGTGGQREPVAVLFADVRGFTQFAEAHTPEEVMRAVNAYLHGMTEALHRHGGLLDKYTGDGLMALFRLERGGSVQAAVRAALDMRDAALAMSADRTAGGDRSLQVGISIHVGEAVVGLVGNPERQVNFTALGHTVVVAARLQTQAAGGEVVVSRAVHEAAGDAFAMTPRPPVRVKGITEVVEPFLVERRSAG